MKHVIDVASWERQDTFLFFKDFYNPYLNVTCLVDCTAARSHAKKSGHSFFLYYLHAIAKAINDIPEFRYRIDSGGNVVMYDKINILTPIKNTHKSGYTTVWLPYNNDRETFIKNSEQVISSISDGSSFEAERGCAEYDVVLVSAIPNLPFLSLNCTQKRKGGNDYPLINVGMLDNNQNMPVALSAHHGFVDGEHIADFYKKVQETLDCAAPM